MELFKLRMNESDTYKSIALMRHGFDGHPFGREEDIAKERKQAEFRKSRQLVLPFFPQQCHPFDGARPKYGVACRLVNQNALHMRGMCIHLWLL
jgi:hypothetical protein